MITISEYLETRKPALCYHRGYSKTAPENSMAAFDAALNNKGEMIEFDVRLSADNEIIVLHDAEVDRTSDGRGNASKMNIDELRTLDFGSWFGAEFRNERIPLLTSVLEKFRDRLYFDIELKSEGGREGKKILCKKVFSLLEKYGIRDRVIISSFDRFMLKTFRGYNNNIFTGLLADNKFQMLFMRKFIQRYNINSVILNHERLTKNVSHKIHGLNKYVMVYTVNTKQDFNRCINSGADCVISNDPNTLTAI